MQNYDPELECLNGAAFTRESLETSDDDDEPQPCGSGLKRMGKALNCSDDHESGKRKHKSDRGHDSSDCEAPRRQKRMAARVVYSSDDEEPRRDERGSRPSQSYSIIGTPSDPWAGLPQASVLPFTDPTSMPLHVAAQEKAALDASRRSIKFSPFFKREPRLWGGCICVSFMQWISRTPICVICF